MSHSDSQSWFHRRRLPHYEVGGSLYFITFTTAAGVVLTEPAKDIVLASLEFQAGKKYALYACVVMDTHVHAILQPLETPGAHASAGLSLSFSSLAQICHSVKSYSAHEVNRVLRRRGSLWQNESYDRVLRDEADYIEKVKYVVFNPVRAGLVKRPEEYRWVFVEGWLPASETPAPT